MQQIENMTQNKKTPQCGRLLIYKSNMVRQCDLRWNQIEASILLMYSKLKDIETQEHG